MSRDLFVDSCAWYATAVARERHNAAAKRFLGEALDRYRYLVSTNHVIGETYTLIRHKWGYAAASRFLEHTGSSRRLRIVFVTEQQEAEAYDLLARYSDHDLSFLDGTSMVVMKAKAITDCFTFDRHFVSAGFNLRP